MMFRLRRSVWGPWEAEHLRQNIPTAGRSLAATRDRRPSPTPVARPSSGILPNSDRLGRRQRTAQKHGRFHPLATFAIRRLRPQILLGFNHFLNCEVGAGAEITLQRPDREIIPEIGFDSLRRSDG